MPLSVNLYEIDELAAFLLFTLEYSTPLSLVIVNELNTSLEKELVYKLLAFAWLLSPPDKELTPLRFTALRSRRYDILLPTFTHTPLTLLAAPRGTIPSPNVLEEYSMPQTGTYVTPKAWHCTPPGWTKDQCAALYHCVSRALSNKQAWRAYLLARPLLHHPTALLSFLKAMGISQELLAFAEYPDLLSRILEHAMFILAYPRAPMEIVLQEQRREGRLFSIPPDARNRWSVPPRPSTTLIGPPNFIFEDSPYWNEQRKKYQIDLDAKGNIRYESEPLYQEFFVHNFPLDIPDEWSQAERNKSHPHTPDYLPQPNPWASTFHALITPTPTPVSR